MLTIEDLGFAYPDGTEALRGVTLEVPRGIFGLLGPNGAGKSTLMQLIATLKRPGRGAIRFGDIDVVARPRDLRRTLGYLPQDFGVYPHASARDLLDQLAVLKGVVARADRRDTVESLLRTVNLWDARDRAVASFSGGMRQRFGVAQALIGNPRLIIVDEPTAGLDPEERNRFHDILAGIGERAVVLLSTHIVEDVANLCERMAVLAGGRILFAGAPGDLVARLEGRLWVSPQTPASGDLVSSRLVSGQRSFRILAAAPPAPAAQPAQPQLEDAYLAAVKGLL
jgi:ABC-type multidrug transport system ATPase subunit